MKALTLFSSSFSSSCIWLLFCFSLFTFCICNQNSKPILCIPTERSVLLQFKNNLTDAANRLSSWVGGDCCRWSGIVCDNITGHVYEIHLRGPDDGLQGHCHGTYDTDDELEEALKQMLGGTISPSLVNLEQLRYLDLSCNDFGFTPIPAFIGSFKNLRYLNLSKSQFDGEVPHQLGNLSMLRVLDLYHGPLLSTLTSKNLNWLQNLKLLQHLDMGAIDLSRAFQWLQAINALPSLLELHLSSCELSKIPSNPSRVSFTSLTVLDLSVNLFDSWLPGWVFSLHDLVSLDLTSCFIHGLYPGTRDGFHRMPSLKILRLSGNDFVNSSSIINGLSSLSNLRFLDLSLCNLSIPVLGKLQNLTSIVHLDLSNNQIREPILKSLSNLCNLNFLDLQSNNFSGSVSELLENFCECKFPKLELIAFRGNDLSGRLPEKLGRLKSLVNMDLAYNLLTGTVPDSIGSLSLLKKLQINVNKLEGLIPDSIGGLSSLEFLDISSNQFNGSLPESIGRLEKLSFASIYQNLFTGVVTENHFANLTALKTLWAGENKLTFKLNDKNKILPFQLDVLRIGSWNLGPRFPSWVKSQINLTQLDLSNTNISDSIPGWIWTTFSGVTFLNISHNNIQGKLGDVSFLAPGAVLDLSNNRLHGSLPSNFNKPNLDFIDLSYNYLSGTLDPFLCSSIQEPRSLRVLNLANNNLSGVVPDCWINWESLVILNLERNKLSGKVPSSLGNISSLESLDIRSNKLFGDLPASLLNSKSLLIVELAENELTGQIPTSIGGEDTPLKILSLRSNKLQGEIPDELCHLSSIQILDLADNNLSGNLPTCFTNFSVISGKQSSSPIVLYDSLFQNQVLGSALLVTKGRVSQYNTILYLVTTLDLSVNRFSGSIPDDFGGLRGLRYLNLSTNGLTGRIPNKFGEMRQLESLDLSLNHLDGRVPSSFSGLTTLNMLNVSYNNLIGRIPTGPQLQTFSESSFTGNALCGAPLAACQPNNDDTEGTKNKDDESNGVDWILVIFTMVGLVVGFWIMILPLLVSERWRNVYYHFLYKIWIKLQDFVLLVSPCFKKHEPLPQTRSSKDQVQQIDLSQYIYHQPNGFKHNESLYEASSSTYQVPQSDLS